jgi:conjugal transfer pilus assembly protein TraD
MRPAEGARPADGAPQDPAPPLRPWRPGWAGAAALAVAIWLPGRAMLLFAALAVGRWLLARAARRRGVRVRDLLGLRSGTGTARRGPGGLTLGHDPSGREVVLGERQLSAHGLILGASGAGKSTTLLRILADQIERGTPTLVIDLKGSPSFARQLQQAGAGAGRRVRVWTQDGPEHWNPLAHGNATQLKDKLIATERFTEPHFQRAAERYLQLAIQALVQSGSSPSLGAVTRLLEPRRLAALARNLEPAQSEHLRDYLAGLTADQLSAVRGLASRLAIITESHTGAYLSDPNQQGIDLRRALAGDEVVVFSLNSSAYGKLAAQLGTLALQDLLAAVGDRLDRGSARQAIVAIDEFSALGADNVISLLARGREAGVSVLLATQELADLDRAARGLRDQVLGNTALKIAHRQEVPESALAIARMAGTRRYWERGYTLRPGLFGLRHPVAETYRIAERPAVDPEAVRTLPTGDAVLITKLPAASTRLVRVSRSPPAAPAPGRTEAGRDQQAGASR